MDFFKRWSWFASNVKVAKYYTLNIDDVGEMNVFKYHTLLEYVLHEAKIERYIYEKNKATR